MTVFRITSEIKRDIGLKLQFFTPLHSTPPFMGPRRRIVLTFGVENYNGMGVGTRSWKRLRTCLVVWQYRRVTDI